MKVDISKSPSKNKRFVAIFTENGKKIKTTHFGLKDFKKGTYIDHQNEELKKNYLKRHSPKSTNENWNNKFSAGALSRWILWNKKTFDESLKDFKKRFNLK